MKLEGATVAITGANGFVGSQVARRVAAEGAFVRGLIRKQTSGEDLTAIGATFVVGDLGQSEALETLIKDVDVVVHCAATSSLDREEAFEVNTAATERLLKAAHAQQCQRFVHISTTGLYDISGANVIDETSPLNIGESVYTESKAEADRIVLQYKDLGLPVVILRAAPIIGAHRGSAWGFKIPQAIAAGRFPLVDEGAGKFPYVHIESFVSAVVGSILSDKVTGEVINVVDGHSTWADYTAYFARSALPALSKNDAPAKFSSHSQFSNAKAVHLLSLTQGKTFDEEMLNSQKMLAELSLSSSPV